MLCWSRLSFNINQDILWSKVALMITVFKTIETIGDVIYFVSTIFTGRQHFAKTYKKMIRFLQFSSSPCPNLDLNNKNLHSSALLSLPSQLSGNFGHTNR